MQDIERDDTALQRLLTAQDRQETREQGCTCAKGYATCDQCRERYYPPLMTSSAQGCGQHHPEHPERTCRKVAGHEAHLAYGYGGADAWQTTIDSDDITRVEVIDQNGRQLVILNARDVQLFLQDEGRTFKVVLRSTEEPRLPELFRLRELLADANNQRDRELKRTNEAARLAADARDELATARQEMAQLKEQMAMIDWDRTEQGVKIEDLEKELRELKLINQGNRDSSNNLLTENAQLRLKIEKLQAEWSEHATEAEAENDRLQEALRRAQSQLRGMLEESDG